MIKQKPRSRQLTLGSVSRKWGGQRKWSWGRDGRGHDWGGHWDLADDGLRADHWRVDCVPDDGRGDDVVVGDLVAGLDAVALHLGGGRRVDGLDRGGGGHGRDDWQGGRGDGQRCRSGDGNRSCNWCGHGHWGRGQDRRGGHVDGRVVADLRLEGVAVDVRGAADHLVADVLVAGDGVSGLNGLEDSGGPGDGVDGRRLGHEALAVDGGQSGHCRNGWHGGHGWGHSEGWRNRCVGC